MAMKLKVDSVKATAELRNLANKSEKAMGQFMREVRGPKYSAPCLNITPSHGTLKPTREQCG